MKILYINSVYGFGSTGKIVATLASNPNYDSLVCYGRNKNNVDTENSYRFANFLDNSVAALSTIIFDNNLNLCTKATKKLINKIKEDGPDIIHLHNLHGYYLNVELLFNFLKEYKKPVVWTLHDCWPFTGYCMYFDLPECNKFETKCENCPKKLIYPFSIFKQQVFRDFNRKEELFNSLENLTIVTPSEWLKKQVSKSFLKNIKIKVINNGITLPKDKKTSNSRKKGKLSVLAVANYWTEEKGVNELKKIIPLLDKNIQITIVGELKDKDSVFKGCTLINRTENYSQLEEIYFKNDLFINPTLSDNYPTVNIEALAHGLPIVTYNTGGSPEIIDESTGIVVNKYDYKEFASVINKLCYDNSFVKNNCIERSKLYSLENMIDKYNKLYYGVISRNISEVSQ